MRISFLISVGMDHLEAYPRIREQVGIDSNGRVNISSETALKEVLLICGDPKFSVLVSSITTFDSKDIDQFDYFAVRSKRLIKLSSKAWDANYHALGELHPEEKGGWAPISIPRRLVYATRQKQPFDIAHLMDACPELVVSVEMFKLINEIDRNVLADDLLQDRSESLVVEGVKRLASRDFAPPKVASASVGHFKGLALVARDAAHPSAELSDLGVSVHPAIEGSARPRLMRSSEPWSTNLVPGWIANSAAATELASASRQIVLNPLITEGSELHLEHDRFWSRARRVVSESVNAEWTAPWETQDLAPRLRTHGAQGQV